MRLYVDSAPGKRSHATYFDDIKGRVTCYMLGETLVECTNGLTFTGLRKNVVVAKISKTKLVAGLASKDSMIGKIVKLVTILGVDRYSSRIDKRLSEVVF